jgi:hypothetical protein
MELLLPRRLEPLGLVEKLTREAPRAEEKPVAAARAVCTALLQERAIGRDTRARADHDEIAIPVRRQAKARVGLDVHAQFRCLGREKMRRGADAAHAFALVVDGGDGQVQFVTHFKSARSDRVEPRREWAQRADEFFGGPLRRVRFEEIEYLPVADHRGARLGVALDERPQCRRGGTCRMRLEHRARETRDFTMLREPVTERTLFSGMRYRCREIELLHLGDARDEE